MLVGEANWSHSAMYDFSMKPLLIKDLTMMEFLPLSDLGLFLQISLDQHDVWEVQSKDLAKLLSFG